jgi:hypothetical protein
MVHWWAILTIQDTVKNLKLKWDYVHTPLLGCFMHCQVDAYETFGLRTERTIKNSLSCLLLAVDVVLLNCNTNKKASQSNGILIPTQPKEILYGFFPQTCHESHQISTNILRKV